MSKPLGWLLLLCTIALTALIALVGFNQKYWLLPPEDKFAESWKSDIDLLLTTKQGEILKRIQKVSVRNSDHSPIEDWLVKVKAPVETKKEGDLSLEVFLVHQIDNNRYGTLVQYEFIDIKSGNKVAEFARVLWLGIYY